MSAVSEWIVSLTSAIRTKDAIHPVIRRVLVPGTQPLDMEGFVRFQGIGPLYRPGQTPECMSAMQVCVAGQHSNHVEEAALAAGIGAVLTLLADRRIEVLEEVPAKMEDSTLTTFLGFTNVFDRRLVSPFDPANLHENLKVLLSQLASLNEKDQVAIASAIDLHYGSALLFEKDLSAAYTLLVAGVEVLSRRFGTPPSDWSAWQESPSWDKFADRQKLTVQQYEALKSKLMKSQHLRLKETFANYAAMSLPDSFWGQEWNEWIYQVAMTAEQGGTYDGNGSWTTQKHIRDYITEDREILRSALRLSYDARSGFVHSGNRTINIMSELYGLTHETDAGRPLSYASLRSILTELIRAEIRARSSEFALPDLIIKHEAPPADSGDVVL